MCDHFDQMQKACFGQQHAALCMFDIAFVNIDVTRNASCAQFVSQTSTVCTTMVMAIMFDFQNLITH